MVSNDFLANAADRGNFVAWLQERAKPIGGMYLAVGQRHEQIYLRRSGLYADHVAT